MPRPVLILVSFICSVDLMLLHKGVGGGGGIHPFVKEFHTYVDSKMCVIMDCYFPCSMSN